MLDEQLCLKVNKLTFHELENEVGDDLRKLKKQVPEINT